MGYALRRRQSRGRSAKSSLTCRFEEGLLRLVKLKLKERKRRSIYSLRIQEKLGSERPQKQSLKQLKIYRQAIKETRHRRNKVLLVISSGGRDSNQGTFARYKCSGALRASLGKGLVDCAPEAHCSLRPENAATKAWTLKFDLDLSC